MDIDMKKEKKIPSKGKSFLKETALRTIMPFRKIESAYIREIRGEKNVKLINVKFSKSSMFNRLSAILH